MSKEKYDARNSGNSRTPDWRVELEGKLYTTKARKKGGGGANTGRGKGWHFLLNIVIGRGWILCPI